MDKEQSSNTFWEKLATFIVDKRNGFFFVFIGLAIFSIFSSQWVVVNDDLIDYLPEDTETRQGVSLMDDEFLTYATAEVMVSNITLEKAEDIALKLESIEGVSGVEFENNEDHFRSAAALFNLSFSGEASDDISIEAMEDVRDGLSDYDLYISTEVGSTIADLLDDEMKIVMLVAIVIIVTVLFFTSKTYMEIPILLVTFGVAALLNVGTNFLLGEISFISDSIAIILQLALAIDYAIILAHRYTEERIFSEPREAVISALSKAIPEISSSSLTTISGLAALMLMQFEIGFDMGLVLIKAIILSLFSVFTLMPGLLMVFNKSIDKTEHRDFIPSTKPLGRIIVKTKYILPPIFLALIIFGYFFSGKVNYLYGYSELTTIKQNHIQISEKMIKDNFGKTNLMALLVPTGDYEKEKNLIKDLERLEVTDSVTGLANIEAGEDNFITDSLSPRQFSELTDIDIERSRLLYQAYAIGDDSYEKLISGINNYNVPLIDMFFFLQKEKVSGLVTLDDELEEELDDMYVQLKDAQLQLKGENYSRILIETNLPEEGDETFEWLDRFHEIANEYYPEDVLLVGESTNNSDLSDFFVDDNRLIGVTSAVFVMIVLLFTFQSAGLPILLMMIIQGSIWLNFSISYLTNTDVFFISYLIVTSIQMGANIDYAIIITGRYQLLKEDMPKSEAVVEALDQAFPTVLTSGSILASAGLLIGFLSSEPSISSIGFFLGLGTIISMILVLTVLPQILLLGNNIIDKTAFELKSRRRHKRHRGLIRVDGHILGNISGKVEGELKGTILGDVDALVQSGYMENMDESPSEEKVVESDEK